MQVILLEKITHLGELGAVVKVKDGYARNFLIPQGHAKRATKAAINTGLEQPMDEAIVTEDPAAAEVFVSGTDSAAVYVNASTRFTDGGEFGLGCEMGISTQKLHARGPMGLDELSTYKYVVLGSGQVR